MGPELCERVFAEIGSQIERAGFVLKQVACALAALPLPPPKWEGVEVN